MSQQFEFRRSREIGEVLNGTFTFARQHWKPLGKAIFVYAAPFALLGVAAGGFLINSFTTVTGLTPEEIVAINMPYILGYGSLIFLSLMIAYFVQTAIVYEYILLYLDNEDTDITLQDIWNGVKSKIGVYAGYTFFENLIVSIGLNFCIIPGIIISVPGSVFLAGRIFGGKPFGEAIIYSFRIIKSQWWQTFLVNLVMWLTMLVIALVFIVPVYIVSILIFMTSAEGSPSPDKMVGFVAIIYTIIILLSSTLRLLLGSLSDISHALQYFNLVERKEGIGSLQQLERLGRPTTANDRDFEETY